MSEDESDGDGFEGSDRESSRESEGDPFAELDEAVGDREGDPFESLDDARADAEQSGSAPSASDPDAPADPWTAPDTERSAQPGSVGSESPEPAPATTDSPDQADDGDAESSKMSFDVGRRESPGPGDDAPLSDVGVREGDPFENVERAFEEMDVDQIEPDVVWQQLTSAESRGSVGDARKRTYAEVSKHSYCEQCEHFSSPPEMTCNHEGTEIVEFLDMETVRVVDCPIVTERERLEDEG